MSSTARVYASPSAPAPARPDAEKRALGQFFTPTALADFIASFFVHPRTDWRVIDAGAGSGALTLALVQHVVRQTPRPKSFRITAYEIDATAIPLLSETLATCASLCEQAGIAFTAELRAEDFVAQTASACEGGLFSPAAQSYNAAIVNPPYRKLAVGSAEYRRLRAAGIEVTNLYSAFLALLSRLLEPEGELVAIVPRSFCNGPYFRAFRRDFLAHMALRRLHVFSSRNTAFATDDVLQENIVLRAQKTALTSGLVEISSSTGASADPVQTHVLPTDEVISPKDPEQVIHLPSTKAERHARQLLQDLPGTLAALNLTVSTGRVVDFRVRDLLRQVPAAGTVPLLYPCHFRAGALAWPQPESRKPNALQAGPERPELLIPAGDYVVLRRFSTKEEKRRIVATLLEAHSLPDGTRWLGLENHLNYFHREGRGLPLELARGLTAYLNWSVLDHFFRQFNGHTQVNATDLRRLPYPTEAQLLDLGKRCPSRPVASTELDALVSATCLP